MPLKVTPFKLNINLTGDDNRNVCISDMSNVFITEMPCGVYKCLQEKVGLRRETQVEGQLRGNRHLL